MPIISVADLRKSYGKVEAVRGISFAVSEGEVFGLLGPNGAGKTTTVEILEGLRKADGGSAVVDGIDVAKEPAKAKERVGVQLQQSSFPENFATLWDVRLNLVGLLIWTLVGYLLAIRFFRFDRF